MTSRAPRYTTRPFAEELPLLLDERQISLRALATRLELDHSFLGRAVRGADGKVLTLELVRRIAAELSIPPGYFRPRYIVGTMRDRIGRSGEGGHLERGSETAGCLLMMWPWLRSRRRRRRRATAAAP